MVVAMRSFIGRASLCAWALLLPLMAISCGAHKTDGASVEATSVATEEYNSLDQMPVATLQIKDCGDGLVNVKARCVPAQQFIDEVAKYLAKPVRVDVPLCNYFSVWAKDDKRTPDKWLSLALTINAYGDISDQGDFWRIACSKTAPGGYDASAAEADLLATPQQKDAPAPVTPTAGIQEGLYFFKGYLIPPPYCAEVGELASFPVATLNSIGLRSNEEGDASSSFTEADIPAKWRTCINDWNALQSEANKICESVDKQGGTWEQAKLAVLDLIKQKDWAEIRNAADPLITISDKRLPGNRCVMCPEWRMKLEKGIPLPTSSAMPAPSAAEKVQKEVQRIERGLRSDHVVVNSGRGEVELQGEATIRQLSEAFSPNRSLLEKECLVSEVIRDRGMARQLIVSTHRAGIDVVPYLNAIAERLKNKHDAMIQRELSGPVTGATAQGPPAP